MNEWLALAAVVLAAVSGLTATPTDRRRRTGDLVAAAVMLMAAGCGLVAAFRALAGHVGDALELGWPVPGGRFAVRVDALSALFLAQIFVIGALGSVYGTAYWPAPEHPRDAVKLRVFYGLAVAGMALLVVAQNGLLFLMGWEIMALAAFLLVSAEDDKPEVRESGYVYLVATRIGTLALLAMFLVLRASVGSFSLALGGLSAGSPFGTAAFLLGVVGFGIKAGAMPMHVWLPGAHANAPTHVSALMSGVFIKMGIYGLFRLTSFYDQPPLWWGGVIFALGCVSAILGVLFAIGQHDLKRLLAYHSVENIGIIAMGLGLALYGRASHDPTVAALGMAGAALHVWNHGLFKALLFFGAGSVIHATHTRDIDALGGLAKNMPRTALAFLIGAVAICGLPPLNGFVSELFVYLASLRAALGDLGAPALCAGLGAPALALVGALAAACFVKVFGAVFLGAPRSSSGRSAHESPPAMLLPMTALCLCCAVIGLVPLVVAPPLQRAVGEWLRSAAVPLTDAAPLAAIAASNALLVVAITAGVAVLIRRSRTAPRALTWDCGYAAPMARMQYTASSFGASLVGLFALALRPRRDAVELPEAFPAKRRFHSHVPEVVLDLLVWPASRRLAAAANWFRWLQAGSIHLYFLYVLCALVVMLIFWR